MRPLGVHHVAICVGDLGAALSFYVDTLGLEAVDRPDFGVPGAWLQAGGQQVHLVELDENAHTVNHFALQVDDLDAVVAELRSTGVEVSDPSPVGPGRQSFVKDPAGNLVELNQPDR